MIKIFVSDEIKKTCPNLRVLAISCDVRNTESDEQLWKEIAEVEMNVRFSMKLEEINKWLPIRATRQAYKECGKDPNRYRPSSESLLRRIVRNLPLYKVDTLVDLINLLSIQSGYSIGGFDAAKITGDRLTLGIGQEGELYHGIGRGILNIAGLPVYRDSMGGIGTPTSDEERTKISRETNRLLMIINGYSGLAGLKEAGEYGKKLLGQYVFATNMETMLL